MKNILIIAGAKSKFTAMIHIACLIKSSDVYCPIIFFPVAYPSLDEDFNRCRQEGIQFLSPQLCDTEEEKSKRNHEKEDENSVVRIPARLFIRMAQNACNRIIKLIKRVKIVGVFFNIESFHDYLIKTAENFQSILFENNIVLLILPQDTIGELWLYTAKRIGIPTMIVPFYFGTADELSTIISTVDTNQVGDSILNRLLAFKYPQWVYIKNGKKILRLPGYQGLALEKLGCAPPKPWVMNSAPVAAVAVESPHQFDIYCAEGVEENKLFLVGSITDDIIFEQLKDKYNLRNNFYQNKNLTKDLPLILCAFPPNQLTGRELPGNCEFENYNTLIDYWVDTLVQIHGWNVVFKFHPRQNIEEFSYLSSKYGAEIASEDTAELMALCDLFITSGSATIRWALTAGIPVVNYDVYQYDFRYYKNISGLFEVSTKDAFQDVIKRITSDKNFYDHAKADLSMIKNQWGCLNGQSGTRIISLIRQLIVNQENNIKNY